MYTSVDLTAEDILWAKTLLSKIDFFQTLTATELNQIIESLEKKYYNPGQTIIFQGEISNKLYLVHDGTLSILVRHKGKKTKVAELHSGDYFGEISLIESTAVTATVRAEKNCLIYALTNDDFQKITKTRPEILQTIKNKIAERKKSTNEVLKPSEQ